MSNELGSLQYRFESAALPQAASDVMALRVEEALNAPYTVDVHVRLHDADADVAEMLGRDCVIAIERAPLARRICGIVRTVQQGEEAWTDELTVRLGVVPALWMLSLRRNTRMFQNVTVPAILETVLGEGLSPYGRSVQLELLESYPSREYCLQYQESDLGFVQRLMDEEGISYTFDHDGETEVLVLRDRNASFAKVPTVEEGVVELHAHDLHAAHIEPVLRFTTARRHTTTAVAIVDHDWTVGGLRIEDQELGEDALGRVRESYEHGSGRSLTIHSYDQGVRRYQKSDAARQKLVRKEAHGVDERVGTGVSRVIGLAPGRTFELRGHPTLGMDGEYLVTRVLHLSELPGELSGEESANREPYHNRFESIPLAVPYRPKRVTPKPRVPSIQTAIVTGPAGEEIHTDEHGRVKVQFHWDRENPADDTSSAWIRCQQTWAGAGWGTWWVPRIGMEVIVQFIDGDPDRPVVTGCLYNGTNATPYPLPDEKTKSTIKSNSSPGGGGYNELRFEDKAGSEEIFTHAQKDYNEVVENDHTTHVKNCQTNTVDVDQAQTIGNDQVEHVKNDQTMTVDANRTVHVKGNFDETVDGDETRTVQGSVTETIVSGETRTISSGHTETIDGGETRTVTGGQTETVTGGVTQTVNGAVSQTINGALTQTIAAGAKITTPAAYSITATGGLSVVAPAGVKIVATGGYTLVAPAGQTTIDSWFTSIGGKDEDLFAMKTGILGAKIDIVATATFSYATLKVDITGSKASITGAEYKNSPATMETFGEAIGMGIATIVCPGLAFIA